MAEEIAEAPDVAARLLGSQASVTALVDALALPSRRFAVVCGRGSSGLAGVFLRYLIETRLGLAVCELAPSVITVLERPLALEHALFIVISQSGESPDLIAATEAANRAGAVTVAILNRTDAPLGRIARHVLPMQAEAERAVAATKTVIASLTAAAQMVATASGDAVLGSALARLPARLVAAAACDWDMFAASLVTARAAFVAGRGFGLAPAKEIALKLTEVLTLPALGYSAAELRHGPRAAITAATPVLALSLPDATRGSVDTLVASLRDAGVSVSAAGGAQGDLPWLPDDHPVTDAIALLMPAYAMIERAARRLGRDPDSPPHLSKVTRTL
jgi:glucosamine--fructose-6-phosphate aminotransferase (isomerizing)